jgi:hypothetical protein
LILLDGSDTQTVTGRAGIHAALVSEAPTMIAFNTVPVPTGAWEIGRGGSSTSWYFDGPIAEVIALPAAVNLEDRQKVEGYLAHKWGLSEKLIANHPYKNSAPVIEVGPVGDEFFDSVVLLLKMESNFSDSSNLNVTASPQNGVTTTETDALFGSSLILNGTNQYLEIAHDPAFSIADKTAFTLEGFIKTNKETGVQSIFNKRPGSQAKEYGVALAGKKLAVFFWDTGSGYGQIDSVSDVPINAWTHIAVCVSAPTISVFVNGVLENSGTFSGDITVDTGPLLIGKDANSDDRNFSGLMDELRITSGVARYTEDFTPPTEPFPNSGQA